MFGRAGRMVRHLEATGVGLVLDDAVVVDDPDPRAAEALVAASRGEHAPARQLLTETRETADWSLRADAVQTLAARALDDGAWLERWRSESADDPDALAVEAHRRILEAWTVRTAARAKDVSEDRFRAFHALLDDALPVIEAAVAANPGDPVPYEAVLTHCLGAQAPREVFDTCLGQALACAPDHLPTHLCAVQFLADKWYGSHEEMLDYASRAAAGAAKDSPVRALEIVALTEVNVAIDSGRLSRRKDGGEGPLDAGQIDAIIAKAQAYSMSRPPEDSEARLVRNHLVWALNRRQRWAESLDVYRSIGRHATESPWEMLGDPRTWFLKLRDAARAGLAASTPRHGSVPEPAVPLPESAKRRSVREIAYVQMSPHRTSKELLLSRVTVRLAPAGPWTLMERAPSQETAGKRGRMATLLRLDGLVRIAETAFSTLDLPVLVARCEADGGRGLTVVRKGATVAAHRWSGAGELPSLETAGSCAGALVRAAGEGDVRQITQLLRDPGDPSALLVRTLVQLGLPPLPVGFGDKDEVLAARPGSTLHQARSVWQGMKDFMADDTAEPPELSR